MRPYRWSRRQFANTELEVINCNAQLTIGNHANEQQRQQCQRTATPTALQAAAPAPALVALARVKWSRVRTGGVRRPLRTHQEGAPMVTGETAPRRPPFPLPPPSSVFFLTSPTATAFPRQALSRIVICICPNSRCLLTCAFPPRRVQLSSCVRFCRFCDPEGTEAKRTPQSSRRTKRNQAHFSAAGSSGGAAAAASPSSESTLHDG